ncbi:MAG: hypothetical protein RDV48_17230 [Candidatus Eremiobacteraeota bacterium]|nr:hypothetical protein [Candidatus Eremiobacteraeota bacterium]
MSEPGVKPQKGWVYVIRLGMKDGTAWYPVMVKEGQEGWEKDLDEAEQYFEKTYKGRGFVTVHYAENVYSAGVNDVENLLEWKVFKEKHYIT